MLKSSVAQCHGSVDGTCVWIEGTVVGQLGANSWVLDDQTACVSCTSAHAPISELFWAGCLCKPLSSCSGLISSIGALGEAPPLEVAEVGSAVVCFGVVMSLLTPEGSLHTKIIVFKVAPAQGQWLKGLRLGRGLL